MDRTVWYRHVYLSQRVEFHLGDGTLSEIELEKSLVAYGSINNKVERTSVDRIMFRNYSVTHDVNTLKEWIHACLHVGIGSKNV